MVNYNGTIAVTALVACDVVDHQYHSFSVDFTEMRRSFHSNTAVGGTFCIREIFKYLRATIGKRISKC